MKNQSAHHRGIAAAQMALIINALLAATKLIAGIVGNAYALVADGIESIADLGSSIVVWRGLAVARTPADDDHPYGHGKAEPIAAATVSIMLVASAIGVAVQAIIHIRTPHHMPAAWTLGVIAVVVISKAWLYRRVDRVARETESSAIAADASHHVGDAVSSAAAFIGISVAIIGARTKGGAGWEAADDWAALVAAGVILVNGLRPLRPAVHDLMDRMPSDDVVAPVRQAATATPGVLAIEKLHVRRTGVSLRVTVHVQADPRMSLDAAHELGHRVQDAIRQAVPRVEHVLVHMEPYPGVSAENT